MNERYQQAISFLWEMRMALLIAIWTTVAIILFLPAKIAQTVAVDEFREEYRIFLGPTLIMVTAIFIARAYVLSEDGIRGYLARRRRDAQLRELTQEEVILVARMLSETTIYVPLSDGVMGGLVAKRIAYRASSIAAHYTSFAYNLYPWVREYAQANPEILDHWVQEGSTISSLE